MTLVLSVTRQAWESHVGAVASRVNGLVPVVKGNGYGFGREWLARRAATLASHLAVGTADEVSSVPTDRTPVVLTPLLTPDPTCARTPSSRSARSRMWPPRPDDPFW